MLMKAAAALLAQVAGAHFGLQQQGGAEALAAPGLVQHLLQASGIAQGPFSVERLVFPMINEAAMIAQENIATIPDIDMAMIAGTGMSYQGERVGPLAIADEIGLDVVLAGLEQMLHAPWGGERFRPSLLLKTKVRAGHLGKQSGRGFHEHMAW